MSNILNVNKLINSEYDSLKLIGWFLYYSNNGDDGLNKYDTEKLINMLVEIEIEDCD